jgi:hypothetical protein
MVYLFILSQFPNNFKSNVVHCGQYAVAIIVFACF